MCLLSVTFVLGLLLLIPPTYADCPTSFFAEDISKDEAGSYKFYFTGRSITSAADCARYCARRQFCRTALFDETASTCAITYDLRNFCHIPTTRFNSFTSKSAGLVAISCVDYCPYEDQTGSTGRDSTLTSTVKSAGIPPGQNAASIGPADPVLVVSFVTAPKDSKESDSILTSTASAGILPGQSGASAGPADPILVLSFATPPKGSQDGSITPTLVIRTSSLHSSTATSASTEASTTSSNAPSTTTTEYTGPSFITASNLGESNPSGDDEKPFSPMDIGIAEAPCFEFQPRRALVNAVFATELVNSLEECKCLCASSWLSNRYLGSNCKSVQYSPRSRECHLNTADHQDGNLQHVGDDQGDYYWFECYRTEHAVTNFVLNECRGLLSAPLQPSGADPAAPCFEVINSYLIKGTAGGLEHDVSIEQCQCYCAHSQTSGRYAFQCLSATYYHEERDCVLNLDNHINRTDLYKKNDKAQYRVSYMGMMCTPDRARAHFPSRAVGVSNDAIEQVCGRFDANTLVIHPITAGTKYGLVTESSITANGEVDNGNLIRTSSSSKSVDSLDQKYTPATGVRVGIALKPGVNSDPCFLELPNYVLEGMALAIETQVTVEACKCYCVGAERRYGAACQSFQYYYDSKTCLINRENRISHPDRFDNDPSSSSPHSYFDYRCAANGVVLDVYVDTTCEGLNIDVSIPKDSQASFPVETAAVKFVTSASPSSSGAFSSAFITADPNEAEESTPKKSAPSYPIESSPVKFGKIEWDGSRSTSGAAFITADPNDVEESTSSPRGPVSSAIEAPEIISSGGGKPPPFEPSVVTLASFIPSSRGRTPIIHQRLVSPRADILRSDTSATLAPVPLLFEVKTRSLKETTKASKQRYRNMRTTIGSTTEVLSTTTSEASTSSSTTTTEETTTAAPSTTTEASSTTTAESISESSTGRTFKPVGPCRYSAIYETAFQGTKMVERLEVASPAQCFSACKDVGCRSANLILSNGGVKHCELFRDSFIDYRTPDILAFDSGTVYFDSIECSEKV